MDATQLRVQLGDALEQRGPTGDATCLNAGVLGAAMDLGRRLASGSVPLETAAELIQSLQAEAFAERAERLGRYLGETEPSANRASLKALFEALAERGEFDAYAAAVSRPSFGIVLTGHPTFALARDLSDALVELATDRDGPSGERLDQAGRAARMALAAAKPHDPPDPLTLDVEHAWSTDALHNALDATETATAEALAVARRRWPERWTELTPRLLTLATWVGFDQDGRTDVTWRVSVGKRLDLKLQALLRLDRRLEKAGGAAGPARALLQRGAQAVGRQAALLEAAKTDDSALPAFAQAMVEGREAALTSPEPLVAALDRALGGATDDQARETLLLARAHLATQGLSLAHIHVRLNAAQLHAGVRRDVGLETDPGDPANRRTYFHAIDDLIRSARPCAINFGSLQEEPSSARRLMMTVAQMAKFIDASAPVRFLIAESESGFTLLSALYLARLFRIEEQVEISPLFETAEGFEAGERVIEEALRSEAFRAHLEKQGRLAIEFGFSDSGRFIGQMAATFRIERLRLRLAEMLVRLGLSHLEVVFFNTHGESIGRGGHPGGLDDRLRYVAPPRSRAEFAARGIALKEEESFQGGEGYLPLLTRAAALATVRAALQSTLAPDPEADGDPIYDEEDFASEFFATVQQAFTSLAADPDYLVLLGVYGTRLLRKTGSRPEQRQAGDAAREMSGVHELRAIPNNGLLQQLGWLANTLYGVGRAAAKDPATFAAMLERSPRFRRALEMVAAARQGSLGEVLRAYTGLLDPDAWMGEAARAGGSERALDQRLIARAECVDLDGPLGQIARRLELDALALDDLALDDLALDDLMPVKAAPRRARLRMAHTLRIALMAAIDRLGASAPARPGLPGPDPDQIAASLMRFDVRWALTRLEEALPQAAPATLDQADFGEPASYRPATVHGGAGERERLIAPIATGHGLCLQLTSAITHDLGACG